MNIHIVTVNYNSSDNTVKLLESLKNQTDKNFDVLVVDNNSNPDQKTLLKNYRTEETNIVFIENDQNLGYSGGNNTGIRRALQSGAVWVLLLNNDTWVKDDFISRLKANLEGKEGIIGLAIDEGGSIAYAGKIEWLKPTLKHVSSITYQVSREKDLNTNYLLHNTGLYAIGGAMAIHKSVFDRIGFLDEKYFLYFEDADYSVRARKVGVPIEFLPEIKVGHSVSASTKKLGSPMLLRYHYRNALYFNIKHGPWYVKSILWIWRLTIMAKQAIKITIGKNKEESKAILQGVFDYYRRSYGKI